jgi:hypothetical protein
VPKALVLGNSHVASVKIAYDQDPGRFGDIVFFAATGRDLAFTRVEPGRIVGTETAALDLPTLRQFSPELQEAYLAWYLAEGRPSRPVAEQFLATGGSAEIALADVDAIFYLCGPSPYDFIRAGEGAAPTSTAVRRVMLQHALDRRFLLRTQILALRDQRPDMRHYLVGAPLMSHVGVPVNDDALAAVRLKRAAIQAMARDFLFDDVFMPDEAVLEPNLLVTRATFFDRGLERALEFQQEAQQGQKTDTYHANAEYGAHLLKAFVAPRVQRMLSA